MVALPSKINLLRPARLQHINVRKLRVALVMRGAQYQARYAQICEGVVGGCWTPETSVHGERAEAVVLMGGCVVAFVQDLAECCGATEGMPEEGEMREVQWYR